MTKDPRPADLAARLALLGLLACGVACIGGATCAQAETRFGDSTWVAPAEMFGSDSTTDTPRVAIPDHERRWETVLRAPFRVVFFPLRLLASGLEATADYVGPRYLEPKAKVPPKPGPALGPNFTFGAVRDIGLGPSITWAGFPTADAKLRLNGSWSANDRRRVQFSELIGERRPVGFVLRGDYDYKPNRRYYGIGNNSPKTDLSYFLLASANAEAGIHLGASPLRQLRLVGGYSSVSPGRGYNGQPLLEDVFATGTPYEHRTTQELWYGLAGDLAALDDDRNPSLGVHGRVDVRRATGLRSSDPDYNQWSVEGRAYVPVFAKRRVIAFRSVFAGIDPSGGSATILPFYRLVQSRGDLNFAGFPSERFRDRQLMLGRIEYRWEIIHRMSAVALYELGEVAPRTGSFSLRSAHKSYGGGLRFGMSDESTMRIELAKSVEGLEANLVLGRDF
jgi:surface antigen Omp85-like protein